MNSPDATSLVIDVVQMRPACVLLQAVMGGNSATLNKFFDSEDWLINMTPDMRMIRGTPEQWAAFSKKHSVLKKAKRAKRKT